MGPLAEAAAGIVIEKAIEILSRKLKPTDLEGASKAIKKVIGDYFKHDGNDNYKALKTWNTEVIQNSSDLTFCLEEDGIYQSIKRFQGTHSFTKKSDDEHDRLQEFIIPEEKVRELSKTLSILVREKAKADKYLKIVAEEFDDELEKEFKNARDEHTHKIVDQIYAAVIDSNIKDDNVVYYQEFRSPLFLEGNRKNPATLEYMYCSPVIHANKKNTPAADIINNWFYYDDEHRVLLLFGDAGVGKSSLCRKMVRDAADPDAKNREFTIPLEKLHIIPLRDKIGELETWVEGRSIKKLLETLFEIKQWPIENELFVLDGLDEVEVLSSKFPLTTFLSNLHTMSECGIKILITSRKTDLIVLYGTENYTNDHMQCFALSWTKETVHKWCNKYKNYQSDPFFDKWMEDFLVFYDSLPEEKSHDERREILQIPVILYIVCSSRIKVTENSSIGSIYDQAFRTLLHRKHITEDTAHEVIMKTKEDDRISDIEGLPKKEALIRQVQWQFTKELAFQMYLHNTMTLSDKKQPDAIANAKSRTIAILKQNDVQIPDDYQINTKAYFAVFHFAREKSDETGVVFAHKTVYEYFTAVKLYEDFLCMKDEISYSLDSIWDMLVGAFRYKSIDKYVLEYLKTLHEKDFSSAFETMSEYFYQGIRQQYIISKLFSASPIPYYDSISRNLLPLDSLNLLFSNLTNYMTYRGFQNDQFNNDRTRCQFDNCMRVLLQRSSGKKADEINLSNWNLSNCDLRGVRLEFAILLNVNLRNASLIGANLLHAQLKGAHLEGAHLEGANLKDADLSNAHLEGARLDCAYIVNTKWEGATYDSKTVFPIEFTPKNKNMKKVII